MLDDYFNVNKIDYESANEMLREENKALEKENRKLRHDMKMGYYRKIKDDDIKLP